MGPSLKDKVAIVTDIGSESGQAIAARFVAEGAQVGGCRGAGVRAEALPKTLPDGVLALEGDIAVPTDAQRIVDTVVQRFGRLDILVNHGAGGRLVGTVLDAKKEDLQEVMAGDVWSVIALSAAAIPAMRKGGGGSIVNIASIARLGLSQRPLRSASQAALGALTRSMAIDHAAENIRVNSLLLGPTLTSSTPPAQREQWEKTDPMHKVATPEDVAAGTLFLASDESRVLTGALIPLDAGRSLPNW